MAQRVDVSKVSIGLSGRLGPGLIARLAPVVERSGFGGLWVNDTPDGDALAALAAAARTTSTLRLATGVVPVDRRPVPEIVAAIDGIPRVRLTLGIGSGTSPVGSLERIRSAVGALRDVEPTTRIVVGSLGPKMRSLGADLADGVVLSWLPPESAREQALALHGRHPRTHVALYVRTALDSDGVARLRREASRYERFPNYAANFRRLGSTAEQSVFVPATYREGLRDYSASVDEVVLRALTADDEFATIEAFIERASAEVDR